jgi:hypothetical protein
MIALIANKNFRLTPLAVQYLTKQISFPLLFKNQMLLYSETSNGFQIFPYRVAFEVLRAMGSMTYIEFLYGLYSIQPSASMDRAIEETCRRIQWIRDRFPNVELTSEANREKVRAELNTIHPVGFSAKDVWTDRLTTGNQYRYVMRHLELFDDLFATDWTTKVITVKSTAVPRISEALTMSDPKQLSKNGGYGAWVWIPVNK